MTNAPIGTISTKLTEVEITGKFIDKIYPWIFWINRRSLLN
ncbi:MAG TPA: hypothetical protein V6D25_03645 [Leptolyngbyaceae cyanobacterium]